jgi:hypothetical protein
MARPVASSDAGEKVSPSKPTVVLERKATT